MSHFGNIGHHLIVAIIDHIPNGWVMFNGDIQWPMINQHSNTWGSTYINGPNVGLWTAKYNKFALHVRMVGKIDPVDWNKPKQFSVMAWTGLRIAVCQRFSMWDSEILMLKPIKPCFYYYSLVVKPCSAGFHSHFWLVVPRHSVSPYNSW